MINMLILRGLFVVILGCAGYFLSPFKNFQGVQAPVLGGIAGLVLGLGVILFEMRLKEVSLKRLIGAAIGSTMGIMGAFLMAMVLGWALNGHSTLLSFLQIVILLWMTYIGLVIGGNKGDMLNLAAFGGVFGGEVPGKQAFKILDTSVIIDGRIADIAETGFLDGTLVIPQFVLRELQLVADSA